MGKAALERRVAADLRALTRALDARGHEAAGGFLGGEWGYGAEYIGTTFRMHPFWWGDCGCGFDDREAAWDAAHPHTATCYQSELVRAGWPEADIDLGAFAVARGLPAYGCAVHCTCGQDLARQEWHAENGHHPDCPVERPNFAHPASGVQVRWYKYIGRGMELAGVTAATWAQAIADATAEVDALPFAATGAGAGPADGAPQT